MNALEVKIAGADTEMLMILADKMDNMPLTQPAQRLTAAKVNEELARRFPETADALAAWYEDLDSEETMFQVILANLNEMPKAA